MRLRATIALSLAASALGLLPTVAGARSTVLTVPGGISDFSQAALAGNHLVYTDSLRFRQREVHVAGPGGNDHLLIRFDSSTSFLLAASPQRAAILTFRPGTRSELYAGPSSGPLAILSRCTYASWPEDTRARGFAVDGAAIAYLDDGCRRPATTSELVVQSGTEPPLRFPLPPGAHADYVSLAGDYVAYRLISSRGEEIVVDDWRSGTEAMRVPTGSTRRCGDAPETEETVLTFCGIAVQSDGKVAEFLGSFAYYAGGDPSEPRPEPAYISDTCEGTISWLSPGDPRRHLIWSRACTDEPVRMASDRVLFATSSYFGIGVVDLRGHELDLGEPDDVYGFDGQHAFVDTPSCTSEKIVAQSALGADPPLPFPVITCPMHFRSARLHLGRNPRLSLVVDCRNGCIGPVVAGTENWVEAASKDFIVEPGRPERITIRLSPRSHLVRNARGRQRSRVLLNYELPYYEAWKPAVNQVDGSSLVRIWADVIDPTAWRGARPTPSSSAARAPGARRR